MHPMGNRVYRKIADRFALLVGCAMLALLSVLGGMTFISILPGLIILVSLMLILLGVIYFHRICEWFFLGIVFVGLVLLWVICKAWNQYDRLVRWVKTPPRRSL